MGLEESNLEYLKQALDLILKYPRIKNIDISGHKMFSIELYEAKPEVETQMTFPLNLKDHMPSDDVMLFAATEDPEEAMKASRE